MHNWFVDILPNDIQDTFKKDMTVCIRKKCQITNSELNIQKIFIIISQMAPINKRTLALEEIEKYMYQKKLKNN